MSEAIATENEFQQFIHNLNVPRLTEVMSASLEGPMTYEGCKEVLASLGDGKSPGNDGLTTDVCNVFFDIRGGDLVESLNTAHEKRRIVNLTAQRLVNTATQR